jgi:hypothetical protein
MGIRKKSIVSSGSFSATCSNGMACSDGIGDFFVLEYRVEPHKARPAGATLA